MILDEKVKAIEWLGNRVRIIDQTKLPQEEVYLEFTGYQDIVLAIKELKIRGAPAIGVAGAYGMALGALEIESVVRQGFLERLRGISRTLAATRPTARNLFRTLERMEQVVNASDDVEEIKKALVSEAIRIHVEEAEASRKLSQLGTELVHDNCTILTHCNTGALATTGCGSALGVVKQAKGQGKKIKVLATETRPLLQGARLTAWELRKANVPVTLITDSMAGHFISRGDVDCVIVGADRIAANGDTANKIGTYSLAVLAKENGIPFYVAAPTTTIDRLLVGGSEIPIEQRCGDEVTHVQGVMMAAKGIDVANPAFDITPHRYITAIITEKGIITEPYVDGLGKVAD